MIRRLILTEIIDTENLNKENTFGKALKKKEDYKISCEVAKEDGLTGIEKIEVLVGWLFF